MKNLVEERIKVLVGFLGDKIIPLRFSWKGRTIKIKEITYSWKDRQGISPLHHFTVSDGQNLYEICYNPILSHWTLAKIECE